MLIFGVRRLLSRKNCQMRPQNNFLRFSLKIQLFFPKNCRIKKIFSIKFLIKKATYIHFWCKMIPDRSHGDTVGRVANKVRVEGGLSNSKLSNSNEDRISARFESWCKGNRRILVEQTCARTYPSSDTEAINIIFSYLQVETPAEAQTGATLTLFDRKSKI